MPSAAAGRRPVTYKACDASIANIAMAAPEELMKNWMAFGGQASEQFLKLITKVGMPIPFLARR